MKVLVEFLRLATVFLYLSGCAQIHHGVDRIKQEVSPAANADEPSLADGTDQDLDQRPAVHDTKALPSPREIFDFHPPGSPAGTWREAFIIDPNDGPLADDVRRTAAELKGFLAGLRTTTKPIDQAPCAALEGQLTKTGCAKPILRSTVGTSRNTPAVP